jgi:hypothetical protein
MADPLTNARLLKASLTAKLKALDDERASIAAELAEVDKFLSAADAYAQVDPKAAKAPTTPLSRGTAAARKRPTNPPREQVLEVVASALERAGRPMQLRELFEAVTAAGITLQGTDPSAVLGTMIWRARKRFANIKGYGYWFADQPYAPASYAPQT